MLDVNYGWRHPWWKSIKYNVTYDRRWWSMTSPLIDVDYWWCHPSDELFLRFPRNLNFVLFSRGGEANKMLWYVWYHTVPGTWYCRLTSTSQLTTLSLIKDIHNFHWIQYHILLYIDSSYHTLASAISNSMMLDKVLDTTSSVSTTTFTPVAASIGGCIIGKIL